MSTDASKPVRRLVGALAAGVDRVLSDPGPKGPRLKTGHVIISRAPARSTARIEALVRETLAPERFVPAGAEAAPPERVRVVNRFVEERWEAVPAAIEGESIAEIAARAMNGVPLAGYRVTQHVRVQPRSLANMSVEQFREHVLSIQRAAVEDDTYNGFFPTIKGNDVMHVGDRTFTTATGDVARGGHEMRGGRAEYKRIMRQQNLYHWDPSCQVATDKIRGEMKAKRDAEFALKEEKADKALPRKIGEIAWAALFVGAFHAVLS